MHKFKALACLVLLVGCSGNEKRVTDPTIVIIDGKPEQRPESATDGRPEHVPVDIATILDAVPQYEPWSKSVNPKAYSVLGKSYQVLATNKGYRQQGIASWYGTKFHQKKTATGEVYDMYQMTAAHKTLPIPSYVRVTNLRNQRTVVVRVNDRGPFHEHRIIDLSYVAAVKLGLEKAGTGFVEVAAVQPGESVISKGNTLLPAKKVYLQLGAFGAMENAFLLQEKLMAIGLDRNRTVESSVADNTLYKVQVGPISSVADADLMIEKIKKIGIYNSRLITE